MTVVAFVILHCIRYTLFLWVQMHVWWSVRSVCVSIFNLMVIQIKVCQKFVCIVFVNSLHSSNEDHVELDFPNPCLCMISTLCCAFAFWNWRSGIVSSQILNSIRWTSHWFTFIFLSLASCWKSMLQVVTREEHIGKNKIASGREETFKARVVSLGSNQMGSVF